MIKTQEGNLLNFIINDLLPAEFNKLISDPETCRTFIRLLSPLSQYYLFRLLLCPYSIPISYLRHWQRPDKKAENENALEQLFTCQVFQHITIHNEIHVQLNPIFKKSLLVGKFTNIQSLSNSPSDEITCDIQLLDNWADKQLENILSLMIQDLNTDEPKTQQQKDARFQKQGSY